MKKILSLTLLVLAMPFAAKISAQTSVVQNDAISNLQNQINQQTALVKKKTKELEKKVEMVKKEGQVADGKISTLQDSDRSLREGENEIKAAATKQTTVIEGRMNNLWLAFFALATASVLACGTCIVLWFRKKGRNTMITLPSEIEQPVPVGAWALSEGELREPMENPDVERVRRCCLKNNRTFAHIALRIHQQGETIQATAHLQPSGAPLVQFDGMKRRVTWKDRMKTAAKISGHVPQPVPTQSSPAIH